MRAVAALTAAAVGLASLPARPQTVSSAGIPMIRDAEIEQLMRDYTTPIFRVAGLTGQNIHVVIIDDKSFNAFVMDAHRIFINVGALMQATVPNQIIGVLAHETGHIVGGHLSKIRQELANAQTAALVGMLLGVGALVAGVRSGMVAIIGGPAVFGMFMDRYDTFWLSLAARVKIAGGEGCFPGVPERSPQQILAAHGLKAGEQEILDASEDVSVTPWRRTA